MVKTTSVKSTEDGMAGRGADRNQRREQVATVARVLIYPDRFQEDSQPSVVPPRSDPI
jgi:hypothetical protein